MRLKLHYYGEVYSSKIAIYFLTMHVCLHINKSHKGMKYIEKTKETKGNCNFILQ